MIFIRFIHPDLEDDEEYQNWLKNRNAGNHVDWRELREWLGKHTRQAWPQELVKDFNHKCWYSEAEKQFTVHNEDVDHFRPTNAATGMTAAQSAGFERLAGFAIPQREDQDSGYSWLEFEPENYRPSNPGVNRAGSKGMGFPVLEGTARISTGFFSDGTEFPLLLDPTISGEPECLIVRPDGVLVPAYAHDGIPGSISWRDNWDTALMKFVRAWTTITVLGLNDSHLVNSRKRKFDDTLDTIIFFRQTAHQIWLRKLWAMCSSAAPFALASRSAVIQTIKSPAPDAVSVEP